MLFRISKISTFESNSQPITTQCLRGCCCSEYQRYQLLRAIHNYRTSNERFPEVVPNIKDINFWEQFTTQQHQTFRNHTLFRISKISTFESNSQLELVSYPIRIGCSEYQRYQLLRAIHNSAAIGYTYPQVVPNIKDINFWEQFTTVFHVVLVPVELFRISKISTFESNSQPYAPTKLGTVALSDGWVTVRLMLLIPICGSTTVYSLTCHFTTPLIFTSIICAPNWSKFNIYSYLNLLFRLLAPNDCESITDSYEKLFYFRKYLLFLWHPLVVFISTLFFPPRRKKWGGFFILTKIIWIIRVFFVWLRF